MVTTDDLRGVLSGPPPIPGELMECPKCHIHTDDEHWKRLVAEAGAKEFLSKLPSTRDGSTQVALQWMYCANRECGELIIVAHELIHNDAGGYVMTTDSYPVRPRTTPRPLDPLVLDPYRRDYLEAAAILDYSPRMSAVLSRKVLADLLKEFEGLDDFNTVDAINKFIENREHPRRIRENLHYVREGAGISAHTKVFGDGDFAIISREQAGWFLRVLDDLFGYFIIDRARDQDMRAGIDETLATLDPPRKPIPPLPDDPPEVAGGPA